MTCCDYALCDCALTELSAIREQAAELEVWSGPDGRAALLVLIRAVAYGATLTIEPRPLLCADGGYLATLESGTGAQYAQADAAELGAVLVKLASLWSK